MKKILFLSLFLLTFMAPLFAQSPYPKGVYLSMEELLEKKASENWNVEIEKRKMSDIHFSGGNDYKLISPDKSIKKKVLKREVVAYSDGDSLYINMLKYRAFAWYAKVESDGPYFVVKAALSQEPETHELQLNPSYNMYGQFGALGGAIGGAKLAELRFVYALDKQKNELIFIHEDSLKEILSSDQELLEQYEKEEEPNDFKVLLDYMIRFNERE